MLDSIKKLLGVKKIINHPFFGRLTYAYEERNEPSHWAGQINYNNETILIYINANKDEPIEAQKLFFINTMEKLETIVDESKELVKEHYDAWCPNKNYEHNFLDDFRCLSISLPVDGNEYNEWKIVFSKRIDEEFAFTVYYENNQAVYTDLDA